MTSRNPYTSGGKLDNRLITRQASNSSSNFNNPFIGREPLPDNKSRIVGGGSVVHVSSDPLQAVSGFIAGISAIFTGEFWLNVVALLIALGLVFISVTIIVQSEVVKGFKK